MVLTHQINKEHKMNKLFKTRIAIMLALLVLGIGLFAQTPVISVSMSRSLRIPHSYDDVIMLPNGDLRFLSFTTNRTGLSVSDFRYLAASDTFTVPTELGVISGLNGTPRRSITADRFGKLYTVYRYPRIGTLKGIVVISFGAEGMDYRVINDLDWGYGFDPQHHVDVVAENTLAIALGTGMICYNLNDGSQMTILDGAGYPSDAGFKKAIALPNGRFLFTYFSGFDDVTHTFIVFDAAGNQVCTTSITDPRFENFTCFDSSWDKDFSCINDRFYLTMPGILYDEMILECHFPTPDSLHIYLRPDHATESLPMGPSYSFAGFADDMIFRAYWRYGDWEELSGYEVADGLYADNPNVVIQTDSGPNMTHINEIGNNLVAVSTRRPDHVGITVYSPLDFPTAHLYAFDAPIDYDLRYGYSKMFSQEGKMLFVSRQDLFAFQISYSVANDDEVATPVVNTFSVFPNPVSVQDTISFKHTLPEPVELVIYNIRGQKVQKLNLGADGSIDWDLRNIKGEKLPAGVYLGRARNRKDLLPFKFVITHK